MSASARPPSRRLKLPFWKSCALEEAAFQDSLVRHAAQPTIQSSNCGTAFSNKLASFSFQTSVPAKELGFAKTANARRCTAQRACCLSLHACRLPRIAYSDHLVHRRIFLGWDLGKSEQRRKHRHRRFKFKLVFVFFADGASTLQLLSQATCSSRKTVWKL